MLKYFLKSDSSQEVRDQKDRNEDAWLNCMKVTLDVNGPLKLLFIKNIWQHQRKWIINKVLEISSFQHPLFGLNCILMRLVVQLLLFYYLVFLLHIAL